MSHPLRFDPGNPASVLEPLRPALEGLELPAPKTAVALRPPARILPLAVTLEDDRVILVQVALQDLDGNGFYAALCASKLADGEPIPFIRPSVALAWGALGAPALVSSVPRARNLQRQLSDGAITREQAFERVGRWIARISAVPAPVQGTLASPEGFRPRRPTWAEEWRARSRRHHRLAQAGGARLGSLADQLLDRIDPSVLSDGPVALVHGGLGPANLFVDQDGEVQGILGWEDSWAGDPQSGLGPLLHLPAAGLAVVLEGWDQPVDAGRLVAYEASYALQALAEATAGAAGPLQAAARQAQAVAAARSALAGTLETRLGEASGEGGEEPAPLGPLGARIRIRAALFAVQREPVPLDGGHAWQATLSTALLAHDLASTPAGEGWMGVADALVDRLASGERPRPVVGIRDRKAWWSSQWSAAVGAVREEGPVWTDALALLWVLRLASERLGGAIDDQALEGVEDLMGGALRRQTTGGPSGSGPQLEAAIRGLGALRDLEAALGAVDGLEALRQRLQDQARAAWEVLEVGAPASPPEATELVMHYAKAESHKDLAQPLAPLLLALRQTSSLGLPAHPGALLTALGVTR